MAHRGLELAGRFGSSTSALGSTPVESVVCRSIHCGAISRAGAPSLVSTCLSLGAACEMKTFEGSIVRDSNVELESLPDVMIDLDTLFV